MVHARKLEPFAVGLANVAGAVNTVVSTTVANCLMRLLWNI